MDVKELSLEQLQELKWNYFLFHTNNHSCIDEIPDNVIFNYYAGISFVNDDFGCTAGKE